MENCFTQFTFSVKGDQDLYDKLTAYYKSLKIKQINNFKHSTELKEIFMTMLNQSGYDTKLALKNVQLNFGKIAENIIKRDTERIPKKFK